MPQEDQITHSWARLSVAIKLELERASVAADAEHCVCAERSSKRGGDRGFDVMFRTHAGRILNNRTHFLAML